MRARADRHAGREPPRRSLVDLRLPQPGLLGSAKAFCALRQAARRRASTIAYAPLRDLVRPYILRRLKTDKRIIADLPDKTEMKAYCPLSRKQAALYQQAVEELAEQLEQADGIQRQGAGAGVPDAASSRSATIPRSGSVTAPGPRRTAASSRACARSPRRSRPGRRRRSSSRSSARSTGPAGRISRPASSAGPAWCCTARPRSKKRKELVRRFQERRRRRRSSCCRSRPAAPGSTSPRPRTSSISTAGGTRRSRTRRPIAPSASARSKNVLVHKFVCRGTVEEQIDQLIESKQAASRATSSKAAREMLLTEMKDDELLKLWRSTSTPRMKEG